MMNFAVVGFRHDHIYDVFNCVQNSRDMRIVAACEEDADTRKQLVSHGKVDITHDSFEQMLSDVNFEVLAVSDYYSKRGSLIIKALKAGKHIISDKPVCTDLGELEQISKLAQSRGLVVGSLIGFRAYESFVTLREIIKNGQIGDVHTISISGQHPLRIGSRPAWYFAPGCHGGTINDIGIHTIDAINWLTGREIVEIVAAREWNAKAENTPYFRDCAQFMLKLDNNGSAFCDVSYLAPDKLGYSTPYYWRTSCHGHKGVAETHFRSKEVMVITDQDEVIRRVPAKDGGAHSCLRDFIMEIEGNKDEGILDTKQVLKASRIALLVQEAANNEQCKFPVD